MKTQWRYYFLTYAFVMVLTACQEGLAGKRAVEFAQVAFVRQDKEIPIILILILPLSMTMRTMGNYAVRFS